MMKKLALKDVEILSHALAIELMSWSEPIPPFKTRHPGKLESCIETPFSTYGGKSLYPTFIEQASILFYLMIKNHPFENGNKRIAVTTLLVFLHRNGKWIHVDEQRLYEFAVLIARSDPQLKDVILPVIHKFLQLHMTDRKS